MLEIEEREAERGEDRVVSQLPSELLPSTFQAISGNRQKIIVFYQDTACLKVTKTKIGLYNWNLKLYSKSLALIALALFLLYFELM